MMLTFVCLSTRDLKNLLDFSGMGNLRVPLPLFQPGSCTTNIHKNVEKVSSSIEKDEYADHNKLSI